jgi:hypothetical protein
LVLELAGERLDDARRTASSCPSSRAPRSSSSPLLVEVPPDRQGRWPARPDANEERLEHSFTGALVLELSL